MSFRECPRTAGRGGCCGVPSVRCAGRTLAWRRCCRSSPAWAAAERMPAQEQLRPRLPWARRAGQAAGTGRPVPFRTP